jgi:hypothetical protein
MSICKIDEHAATYFRVVREGRGRTDMRLEPSGSMAFALMVGWPRGAARAQWRLSFIEETVHVGNQRCHASDSLK